MSVVPSQHNGAVALSAFPATLLHRHALESILSFCNLRGLSVILRVSKEWAGAVHSMRPLGADLHWRSSLPSARTLPLFRHIGSIRRFSPLLSVEDVSLFSVRVPYLHSLACVLRDTWSSLVFPPLLRELDVNLGWTGHTVSDQQLRELGDAIAVIAALPMLESLKLCAHQADSCCLTPLANAPSLRKLGLYLRRAVFDSPTNIVALRSMPLLRSLKFDPSSEGLARFLQPPHELKLELLSTFEPFNAEHGEALVHLSTLTDLTFNLDSQHTDFFHQMPNLRSVVLGAGKCTLPPDVGRIMHSLQSLVGLTELRLCGIGRFPLRFTSDHLAAFPHMPLLTSLHLSEATSLDSLRFLTSGPITRSLTNLVLAYFARRLSIDELSHVAALSSLIQLTLLSVFDVPLGSATAALYKPPSSLLPCLRRFLHDWKPMGMV